MQEQWKYITDLSLPNVIANKYLISNYGNIWDEEDSQPVCTFKDDEGYNRVYLKTIFGSKQSYLHRLVKIEFDGFDPDPMKNQIDHLDANKDHNYRWNLEWVTRQENTLRAIRNGQYEQFKSILQDEDAELICQLLKQGKSYNEISDILYPKYKQNMVGIIGKIYRGERWRHISEKYVPFPELNKSITIPSNAILTEETVRAICRLLESGIGIAEAARRIEEEYSIPKKLENAVGLIKRHKTWNHISKDYNF